MRGKKNEPGGKGAFVVPDVGLGHSGGARLLSRGRNLGRTLIQGP